MTAIRGLYDQLVTEALQRSLGAASHDADLRDLLPEEAADRFAEELRRQLARLLGELADGESGRVAQQLQLFNDLLQQVRQTYGSARDLVDPVSSPPRVLQAIHDPARRFQAPETGLALPWLFTAGRGSPALLSELGREAAACDQIDILVSFITMSGVRKLIDVLRAVTAADASGAGSTRIRVLTTTYVGATELRALQVLAGLNGCEIRISLDGRRTRLHAKAWIFHRRTGFGSAYVGSANLTGAALMGGLEWTVKLTQRGQEALYDRACAHFDTLWLDDEFTPFHQDDPSCVAAVAEALRREGGEGTAAPGFFFDIQPKHYQREILNELRHEREHGRNRNLVVAATGTGKTVIAALDYRNTCAERGDRPRLLYVSHRTEILKQARRTYREVLRDNSFGELLAEGAQVVDFNYLFASIDSLTSQGLVERLGPGYWHTVVIDECHRLAANRFDRLATAIQPTHLLGLTATPERTDGQPISQYFMSRPDGAPAAELRLWDALDMQLLAPFEYYGCDDDTDFSEVPWGQRNEAACIDLQVRANQARARLVIREWGRLAADPRKSRALVFCVSVEHARFMTDQLNQAGLPAECLVGATPMPQRRSAPARLASGELCALVTVDLYNEGVDLPDVDILLLLRPTQSPLLFQQQIGRGLRLSPGKESCLVLDFVGHHRTDFRFDQLLGALTGATRRELLEAVKGGFSMLPPGCHIHLQRQTRDQVLRSLQTLVQQRWGRLATELQSYAAVRRNQALTLGRFMHDQQIPIEDIYRTARPSGWTSLKRRAGLLATPEAAGEAELSRKFRYLTHVDDPKQIQFLKRVAESGAEYVAETSDDVLRAQMLAYAMETGAEAVPHDAVVRRLAESPECVAELAELADVLEARSRLDAMRIPGLEDLPLSIHAAYRRPEILAAAGVLTETHWFAHREGVLAIPARRCELLLVTLDKSKGFHDRIAYRDYAVSPTRFHWQTQNAAGPHTAVGRRYSGSMDGNGWTFQLFVRANPDQAYRACGPVRLASPEDISGDRPMSINWTLEVPLPPRLFTEFSVLRGQA